MTEIKLFYSWQSDLDPKTTRNVIQDAIKAAVKSLKNVVTVDADRDTKGELGSPTLKRSFLIRLNSVTSLLPMLVL